MRPDSCSNHEKYTTKVNQSTDLLKLIVEPLLCTRQQSWAIWP